MVAGLERHILYIKVKPCFWDNHISISKFPLFFAEILDDQITSKLPILAGDFHHDQLRKSCSLPSVVG